MTSISNEITPPVRVVIVIEGGVVQAILTDRENAVEVLVKDYDTEGSAEDDTQVYLDSIGSKFFARVGPDQVDAVDVAQCFAQLNEPENRWMIRVYGAPGDRWVTLLDDEDDSDSLTTTAEYELAAKFTADEVAAELSDLVRRFPHSSFKLERAEEASS